MSAVKEFNSLGGKVVSRNTLEKLAKKAFDEQSFEVHKRVSAILDNHPKAQEFEFEPNSIKKINEKSSLGIPVKLEVFSKQIGKDLVFFYGERKLATIRPNGLIEYETNKFPRGAKTRIRHASSKVGLNSPFDEDMLHGLELLPDGDSYGLGKPVSPNEIYDNITNLMINTIKQVGYLPWQKEWVGSGIIGARNFVTGKPYSGINFFTLNYVVKYDNEGKPYLVSATTEPQYFLTYNQIESFGATIKKGKKARQVVYYNFVLNYKDENLNFSGTDANKFAEFAKKNQLSEAQVESNLKRFPILKYYNVYNSNDVDGLPSPKFYEKVVNVNEYAQFVIDNYPNKPDYRFGYEKAFYSPSGDYVSMPLIRAFKKESSYYSTFFHEITHSTGHKSRLDRDMSGMFGNEKYAFEELIAELGATYLCSETGILFEVLDNSAKYLKGWSKKLISKMEEDNKFFFKAAAAAQKAANFILDTNNPKRKKFVDKKPKTETKTTKSETKKPKTVKKPVKTRGYSFNSVNQLAALGSREILPLDKQIILRDIYEMIKRKDDYDLSFLQLHGFGTKKEFEKGGYFFDFKNKFITTNIANALAFQAVKKVTSKPKKQPEPFDKKPKSVSVATAIMDVLTLPKYKGVKLLLATIIYNKFKNLDDEDFFEVQISSNYEKGVLKSKSDLHDFFEYAEELSLTEKGVEFVKAVNGRLESLRNQKNNYALFDNLGNPEAYTHLFQKMSVVELRKFTLDYYNANLKGKKTIIEKQLKEVVFTSAAGKKIAKGEAMYSAKAAVVQHLEELIKKSSYNNFGNRKDNDNNEVLGYLNFKSKLTIDNEKRHVRISLILFKNRKTELKNVEVGKKQKSEKHKAELTSSKPQDDMCKSLSKGKVTKKNNTDKLGNSEVEQIEVIEPNPIIPIAVELPTNQPEVLDQVNTVEVVEPIVKTNLNPNSLAARKNKNTQPREFYIIENPHIAKLLGNIEKKVKESVAITIAGGQGSGKSSFIFQLIEEFSKNYRVGHASIEEHPESSLYEKKAERYWSEKAFNTVDAPEIKTIEDLDALIKRNDVIVIDSFSKLKSMDKRLTLDDGLRKKYDNKLFIIIYQLTTNNTMRGGSDSQFDGDTILFVEKFPDFNENYVYVDKNRYATDISPDLKYNISQQKIIEDNTETEEIQFSDQIETI